ncbi:MAG: carboxymuconolactone decarboxylase family protein [Pseudomonadota bacterium]
MAEHDTPEAKGRALVQKLIGGIPPNSVMPPDFQKTTIEHLFGTVWQDARLDFQQRSLITCTALVAMGREAEQRIHFVGARNLGIPREEISAMISHIAHYAGWPNAVSAFRVLKEVWPEEEEAGG